jgi:enolase-phosphatase E1
MINKVSDAVIKVIITDIEGTTTDIAFVHQVLFPYARARLADAVAEARDHAELAQAIALVRQEIATGMDVDGQELSDAEVVRTLQLWMDQDRKSTALKQLQGILWRSGYQRGDFLGHVYPDVSPVLQAWFAQGIRLGVYSSGSVAAQKLLFQHSSAGDLTPLFSSYFDTHVGAKRDVQSYRTIAEQLGEPASTLLFLSDIRQELDAAAAAGWQTCQLIRGDADLTSTHRQVASFDQITLTHPSE